MPQALTHHITNILWPDRDQLYLQEHQRGALHALGAACRPRLLLRFLQLGVPGALMMSAVRLLAGMLGVISVC